MTLPLLIVSSAGLLVLQTTLFEPLRLGGVMPDLVLILVYLAGFPLGPARGAAVGAASGLWMDLLSAGPPGLNVATKAVAGVMAGLAGRAVLTGTVSRHVLTLGLISLVQGGVTYSLVWMLGESPPWWPTAGFLILPEAVYTGLAGGGVLWGLSRLSGRWEAVWS